MKRNYLSLILGAAMIFGFSSCQKEGAIETSIQKHYLNVKITDTGCGIPNEILDKITDPFFTTKEPGKGTGLGLSITKNIINDLQGKLKFKSKPGNGTTVKIKLPLNKSNEQ